QGLAALAATVDDGDGLRPGQRELDPDGAGSPTGAEHHYPLAPRLDDAFERRQEALAVGVLADEAFPPPDRAIDCAHDLGRLAEAVEMIDHRDLVRQRAVEPRPAHRPGAAHRVAELLGRHLAIAVER